MTDINKAISKDKDFRSRDVQSEPSLTGSNTANDVMANSGANAGNAPWCRYCRAAGHLIGVCRKRIYSEQQKARTANIVSSDPQGSSNNNRGCSNGDNPNDFGEF